MALQKDQPVEGDSCSPRRNDVPVANMLEQSKLSRWPSLLLCVVLGFLISQSTIRDIRTTIHNFTRPGEANYVCTRPAYVLRMLSYDPFVAHLENFITPDEATYLKELAEPKLFPSRVFSNKLRGFTSKARTSSSAFYPKRDPVVQCIRQRASEMQGHLNVDDMDVQATVYKLGQYYREHHDCGEQERVNHTGALFRVSTIFGYLEANCENCGTNFPYVYLERTAMGDQICEFVECDGRDHLTVKAKAGTAVFWRNRLIDGAADNRMVHEGLPVHNGTKYGINIWSHERTEDDADDE